MTKRPRTQGTPAARMVLLPSYVRDALDEGPEDASLLERAARAWGAQHHHDSKKAAVDLEARIVRLFGQGLDLVSPEFFDRADPVECAGGTLEDLTFGLRDKGTASLVVLCAHEGCRRELFGPVTGLVELGRVLSLIEDEKTEGEWKCQEHRKAK